jgi:hypothetical protein
LRLDGRFGAELMRCLQHLEGRVELGHGALPQRASMPASAVSGAKAGSLPGRASTLCISPSRRPRVVTKVQTRAWA